MSKYIGFDNREDVAEQFSEGKSGITRFTIAPDFPTDEQILLAIYEQEDYEGYAIVLFERDGKLYEVHGSHCSCMGLEQQWQPEETSWAALAMRPAKDRYGMDADPRVRELIKAHLVS